MQATRRWAVIGGGPCGIATVGRLLDLNQSVTWIDPSFRSGRMGDFYRRVPANTLNGDLLVATRLCKSFKFDHYQEIRRKRGEVVMADLPENRCFDLGYLVDALDDMTTELLPQVNAISGTVRSLQRTNDHRWKFEVEAGTHSGLSTGYVDAVIHITGCKPKPLPNFPMVEVNQPPKSMRLTGGEEVLVHSLDLMVDPVECQRITALYPSTDRWVVIGDSHSGMLVVKNLVEGGASKNVVNVFRSPLRFMHVTSAGVKKYQGIGLKGPVGDWTKKHITNDNKPVKRIKFNSDQTWEEQLSAMKADHVIVAYGFIRDDNFPITVNDYTLTTEDLDNYDKWTGEIKLPGDGKAIGLYGGGIGFPQNYLDGENEVEPWVGFKRSIEQTDLFVNLYEKSSFK